MRAPRFSSLIAVAALGLVACSSSSKSPVTGANDAGTSTGGAASTDGGGTKEGGSSTGGGSGIPVVDGGCPSDPTAVFDGVGQCLPRDQAVTECKTQATTSSPGTKTTDPTCGAGCTCDVCTAEMLACGADPDHYCATILKCAQEHNCTGVACYAANTCQPIIDAAPGGGLSSYSLALASAISDCSTKTGAIYMGRTGNTCAAACP